MKPRDFIHGVDLQEVVGNNTVIDDANGVIKGVTILTGEKTSLNKTYYTKEALEQARGR